MAVAFVAMIAVVVSVVGVSKRCQANHIDKEAEHADDQQFVQAVELRPFPEPLEGIEYDLYAHKPIVKSEPRLGSLGHRTYIRKMPFAKPEMVSILPKP
jgi:hypothetical protein